MSQQVRPERAVAAVHRRRAAALIALALGGAGVLTLALPGGALAQGHSRAAHHIRLARAGSRARNAHEGHYYGHNAPAVAGTVEGEPVGETFQVKSAGPKSQTYTVTASATTTYFEQGVEKPTIKNVTNEEFVVVFGTVEGTNVTATQVLIFPKPPHFERPVAVGVVSSEPADEAFTIEARMRWSSGGKAGLAKWNGHGFGGAGGAGTPVTVTVHVTSTTGYFERGVEKASLSDVKKGEIVIVFGAETSENSVTAAQVVIGPPFVRQVCVSGPVKENPVGDAFQITTRGGEIDTVEVGEKTTYYERGVEKASLEDVKAGDIVGACGTISGTTVKAEKVFIAPPPPPRPVTEGTVLSEPTATSTSFEIETYGGVKQTVEVASTTVYTEHGEAVMLEDVKKGERVVVFGTISGTTVSATEVVVQGGHGLYGGGGYAGGYGGFRGY